MPSKQQDRGMPGGYGYGSTNDGPPPPGYSEQQQQQQQQQQPRRADVYYDYGTVHDLSISESSLVDDDDEKGMQMCYRGQHDWRTEYGLGGILCAIVRCQIMVVLTFSLTCL